MNHIDDGQRERRCSECGEKAPQFATGFRYFRRKTAYHICDACQDKRR